MDIRPRDLEIRTLEDGREIVGLRSSTAFDETFLQECVAAGVKPAYQKDEDDKGNKRPE